MTTLRATDTFVVRSVPRAGECDTGRRVTSGQTVSMIGRTGDWVLIRAADGQQGWVHSDAFEEVDDSAGCNRVGCNGLDPIANNCDQGSQRVGTVSVTEGGTSYTFEVRFSSSCDAFWAERNSLSSPTFPVSLVIVTESAASGQVTYSAEESVPRAGSRSPMVAKGAGVSRVSLCWGFVLDINITNPIVGRTCETVG